MGAYGSPELNNTNNIPLEKNLIYCSQCGTRYSKKVKRCPQCNKKHAQPFYNRCWFWFMVLIVIFAFYPQSDNLDIQKDNIANTAVSEDEYKASCTAISYDDVARNPNVYTGRRVVFHGEVIQIQESGRDVTLRVNVARNANEDSVLYIDYKRKNENEIRILEKDTITMYGEMNGIKQYQTVLGDQVSVPYLLAEYIAINQNNTF